MKYLSLLVLALFSVGISVHSFGDESVSHAPKVNDKHKHDDHEEGEEESQEEGHEDNNHQHKEEKEAHAHGEGEKGGHGHEEEGGSAIGPEKGITEKGPLGIKLSPEAIKTIAPSTLEWTGSTVKIPNLALVKIKDTKSVFRVREGWYKRVPARVVSREGSNVIVAVEGLKIGDRIVVTSLGFLRMAEVIAVEGASHSHSH